MLLLETSAKVILRNIMGDDENKWDSIYHQGEHHKEHSLKGLKLEEYYNSLLKTQKIIGQLSIFHFVANRPRKYFRVWSNLHKAQIIGCLQKISFLFLFFFKKNLVPTYLPPNLVTNYKKLVGEGGVSF